MDVFVSTTEPPVVLVYTSSKMSLGSAWLDKGWSKKEVYRFICNETVMELLELLQFIRGVSIQRIGAQ